MYDRTCGRSVMMVAAFRRGLCFRRDATGAGKQRQFGFINVQQTSALPASQVAHAHCR